MDTKLKYFVSCAKNVHKYNFSHTSKDCFKLKAKTKSLKKVEESHSNDDNDESQETQFFGQFKSIEAVNPYMPVVKSFASVNDAHPLVTSDPLMTYLNVEGIACLPWEVDSAASHNIISEGCFNKLQKQLNLRGLESSKMLPRTVKIKLADGNMAGQNCPVVQLNVSTDLHKFTNNLALTFLVVKGPNNLIGRHSIARLWPREFERFRQATCENYKIIDNSEIKSTDCT